MPYSQTQSKMLEKMKSSVKDCPSCHLSEMTAGVVKGLANQKFKIQCAIMFLAYWSTLFLVIFVQNKLIVLKTPTKLQFNEHGVSSILYLCNIFVE